MCLDIISSPTNFRRRVGPRMFGSQRPATRPLGGTGCVIRGPHPILERGFREFPFSFFLGPGVFLVPFFTRGFHFFHALLLGLFAPSHQGFLRKFPLFYSFFFWTGVKISCPFYRGALTNGGQKK